MQRIDALIARLRLLLADVDARLANAAHLEAQSAEQLRHIVDRGIYGDAPLEGILRMMADVEERLRAAEMRRRHLETIRTTLAAELESLQLTRGIEQARAELSSLQAAVAHLEGRPASEVEPARTEALLDEIRRLQHAINEAAERAARTLQRGPPLR